MSNPKKLTIKKISTNFVSLFCFRGELRCLLSSIHVYLSRFWGRNTWSGLDWRSEECRWSLRTKWSKSFRLYCNKLGCYVIRKIRTYKIRILRYQVCLKKALKILTLFFSLDGVVRRSEIIRILLSRWLLGWRRRGSTASWRFGWGNVRGYNHKF